MRTKFISTFMFICLVFSSIAQSPTDSISEWQQKPTVNLSGFIEVFYAFDFNLPQTNYRQKFFYNHNRHNEFNLNLGYIKVGIDHAKYRANFALHAGTYSNDNYAAEPGLLKNIFEANVGVSLNKKNNLWVDAGIFSSHIGFESAVSLDNWTLTRSILAENSPYYLAGAKLTFNPNDNWEIAAIICNGWQRIQKVNGNSLPAFCTQLRYTPSEKVTLNWSTFVGTDYPDISRRMRYFSNLYGQFQFTKRFGLIAGFDIGAQQRAINSAAHDVWFSPVLIGQFAIGEKWKTAVRVEYYQDETGILIPTGTTNGFETTGVSLNVDYSPVSNVAWRIEGRWLNSKDKIFQTISSPTDNNFFIATSIAVKF